MRISTTLNFEEHQGKQTFINTNTDSISLDTIKASLQDKDKVFLSASEKHDFFQVFSNGQELSHGLNVVLGGRSSGKSHFLNNLEKIFDYEGKKVKHIEQFSLVREDEEKFNEAVEKERSDVREQYLDEFKEVVEDVLELDRRESSYRIDRYIKSLLEYAVSEQLHDEYSRAILFSETRFRTRGNQTLEKLIEAVKFILENETYESTVLKYIDQTKLGALFEDLTNQYKEEAENQLKRRWVNELVNKIQHNLKNRSASPSIEYNDLDFYDVKIENEKVKRFNVIANSLKEQKVIDNKQSYGKFNIQAVARSFKGASELKKESGYRDVYFRDAFEVYYSPIDFLEKLNGISVLEKTELYRYFCKVSYHVLNEYGKPVSGGEIAEFNLLKALQDARQYEMLLVDEPESSFDNLFLKDNVNKIIKELSSELPVVVVTHNNTVGMLLHPDYILYTKREIVGGKDEYYLFSGVPGDKELKTADGSKKVDSYTTLMEALEAGEDAYRDRKDIYTNFKK